MSKAPERIWAWPYKDGPANGNWMVARFENGTEYVRADRIEYLEREVKVARQRAIDNGKWLGELLAVIHRDGGHYQALHGDEKSVEDAIAKVQAAEAREARLSKALRNIAEGNLGDAPWQANYDKIREVARAALSGSGSGWRNPLEHVVEFVAKMAWRTDPPNANNKLSDTERLSAIKYHPTVKHYGQPHIELAEPEAAAPQQGGE